MYKMTKVERHTFTVTRANNGKITLKTPICNIKWLKVSNIFFKHGPKKKSRKVKKKKNDYSDSDSDEFENGNPDLVNSTYISIKINDFIRGTLYDVDGQPKEQYTFRVATDMDGIGEGDWCSNTTQLNEIHDWDAPDDKLQKIEELNINVSTDKDSSPVHLNFEIELEFGIISQRDDAGTTSVPTP